MTHMTFDEWRKQATDMDLRDANEYRYHFPVEIRVMTMHIEDIESVRAEDLMDANNWETMTVCGCEPGFQFEYGSEGHASEVDDSVPDLEAWSKEFGLG